MRTNFLGILILILLVGFRVVIFFSVFFNPFTFATLVTFSTLTPFSTLVTFAAHTPFAIL